MVSVAKCNSAVMQTNDIQYVVALGTSQRWELLECRSQ